MAKNIIGTLATVVLCTVAGGRDFPYYGICSHLTRGQFISRGVSMDLMRFARIGAYRSDIDFKTIQATSGVYDFTLYDHLMDETEAKGLKLMPVLWIPGASAALTNLPATREYVRFVVEHYKNRWSVIEIMNEINAASFWKDAPNPANYVKLLREVYAEIKAVDPNIKVAIAGFAGVPMDFIRGAYEAGAAACFDIMNVHPYTHPAAPEGWIDVQIEGLRKLMGEFGDSEKPIWVTEIGWPTHRASLQDVSLILAGLRLARPTQKTWRVVVAGLVPEGFVPPQDVAESFLDILPSGSTAKVLTPKETVKALESDAADLVVYPFDETYPAETVNAVSAFVKRGGVLLDFGGVPCCHGCTQGISGAPVKVTGMTDGSQLAKFRFGYRAWWSDPDTNRYPEASIATYLTGAAREVGAKEEPTGFPAKRFLMPDQLQPGDEMIPLCTGKNASGEVLTSAAVFRYGSDWKGAAILSAIKRGLARYVAATEAQQAMYLVRALSILANERVGASYIYNLRADERDSYYSEDHFGIVHSDFVPKPAFGAVAELIVQRPEGSQTKDGCWHDEKRELYFPQWCRPDGVAAGMVWKVGKPMTVELAFAGEVTFWNAWGRPESLRKIGESRYLVLLSGEPVYFRGAYLAEGAFGK